MARTEDYVRQDDAGVFRIAGTRVMLDSVVAGFREGHSPETIQQQYPSLSLEHVYGALAHYLSHADELHAYFAEQDEVWEHWRVKSQDLESPLIERLRALRHKRAAKAS